MRRIPGHVLLTLLPLIAHEAQVTPCGATSGGWEIDEAGARPRRACPVGRLLRETPTHLRTKLCNNKGVDLLEEGRVEDAAVCFLAAVGLAKQEYAPPNEKVEDGKSSSPIAVPPRHVEVALKNFKETQSDVLAKQASREPYASDFVEAQTEASTIRKTWEELYELMEGYGIATAGELASLRTPFDVYMLHGQLICQKDEPQKAIRSLEATLRVQPTSDAFLLLGRIHLGRGEYWRAYRTLLQAYETLLKEETELMSEVAAPRLHAQDMTMTILLTLHSAVSRMNRSLDLAGELHTVLCSRIRTMVGKFSDKEDRNVGLDACEGLDFLPPEQFRMLLPMSPCGAANLTIKQEEIGSAVHECQLLDKDYDKCFVSIYDSDSSEDSTNDQLRGSSLDEPAIHGPDSSEDSTNQLKSYSYDGLENDARDFVCSPAMNRSPWLQSASMDAVREFQEQGYVKLKNILPERYLKALISRHQRAFHLSQANYVSHQRRYTITNEELSIFINMQLAPLASLMFGMPCLATYAFSILYIPGGHIKPHKDRHQNEVSLSLNLGLGIYNGTDKNIPRRIRKRRKTPWPLYISPSGKNEDEATSVIMDVGDGLLYRGLEHVHFRRPLNSGTSTQIIFGFRQVDRSHCNSQ